MFAVFWVVVEVVLSREFDLMKSSVSNFGWPRFSAAERQFPRTYCED